MVRTGRGLCALDCVHDREQSWATEDAMYLGVGVVFLIVLMLLSPVIWIAWWLLGVLGRAKGQRQGGYQSSTERIRRRAA